MVNLPSIPPASPGSSVLHEFGDVLLLLGAVLELRLGLWGAILVLIVLLFSFVVTSWSTTSRWSVGRTHLSMAFVKHCLSTQTCSFSVNSFNFWKSLEISTQNSLVGSFIHPKRATIRYSGGLGWSDDETSFISHLGGAKIFFHIFCNGISIHGAWVQIFFSPLLNRYLFISPF